MVDEEIFELVAVWVEVWLLAKAGWVEKWK